VGGRNEQGESKGTVRKGKRADINAKNCEQIPPLLLHTDCLECRSSVKPLFSSLSFYISSGQQNRS